MKPICFYATFKYYLFTFIIVSDVQDSAVKCDIAGFKSAINGLKGVVTEHEGAVTGPSLPPNPMPAPIVKAEM